jgi:hypothetical protein
MIDVDMTLKAAAARHVRAVLFTCNGRKQDACRVLGISYHTLNNHLRHPAVLKLSASIDVPNAESHEEQLLRLRAFVSLPIEVLDGELRSAEVRGAAEYAHTMLRQLQTMALDHIPKIEGHR